MKEYILCAAIWFHDGIIHAHQPKNIDRGLVVAGRRHHNAVLTSAVISGGRIRTTEGKIAPHIQGFITSTDRFVSRNEAGDIAFKAGQIDQENDFLFSEDLY
jgi:hypothetical protein